MNELYSRIMELPHFVSKKRQQMSLNDRAAQFAPFAALSGYDEAVDETARLTDSRLPIDEERQDYLNGCIQKLIDDGFGENIRVTYFVPDERKAGGKYISVCGYFKRIDEYEQLLCFDDGFKIELSEIYDISVIE